MAEHEKVGKEQKGILSTQEETSGVFSGEMSAAEIPRLTGLPAEEIATINTMPTNEFFTWIAKSNENREQHRNGEIFAAFLLLSLSFSLTM